VRLVKAFIVCLESCQAKSPGQNKRMIDSQSLAEEKYKDEAYQHVETSAIWKCLAFVSIG